MPFSSRFIIGPYERSQLLYVKWASKAGDEEYLALVCRFVFNRLHKKNKQMTTLL